MAEEVMHVPHATIPGISISIVAHAGNISSDRVTASYFEDGYLECVLYFEDSPFWELIVLRGAYYPLPPVVHPLYPLIVLGMNEELVEVGIDAINHQPCFFAHVEDIHTNSSYRHLVVIDLP
jgi:hypothetical protein